MFCPNINGECVGEKCRDWDAKQGKCRATLTYERYDLQVELSSKFMEASRFETLGTKMVLTNALKDPTLSDDVKQLIRQALQAPSVEVAEKLIREAGLIE